MTLREKLKRAAKLKVRENIKSQLCKRFSLSEDDVVIFDEDFQSIVELADKKGLKTKVGVFEISSFEGFFQDFIKNFHFKDTISFMISTDDDYFFAKIPFSVLQQDLSFFWSDKSLHSTSRNRIFIKNDKSSALVILSSEYGLECCQW